MSFELISTNARLQAILSEHESERFVAIDTEFRRRDTFFPQIALVQLCWRSAAYLIDPLAISDVSLLRDLMLNTDVVKLLHSPSEDLEVFDSWLGALPKPLFDTQRAMAMLGYGFGLGYRNMVERFTGEIISKEETTSDWLKRPLTTKQLQYAALDVTYLRQIGEDLFQEAVESDRLSWIYEDGEKLRPGGRGPAAKFKSAWKLSLSEQNVLAGLIEWRESEAHRLDRPRSWILSDKVISLIVRQKPSHIAQLDGLEDLPGALVRKSGQAILSVVADALQVSANQPLWLPPIRGVEKEWAAKSSEMVKQTAESLGIAVEVLLTGRDIEALIRCRQKGEAVPLDLQGWREGVIIEALFAAVPVNASTPVPAS